MTQRQFKVGDKVQLVDQTKYNGRWSGPMDFIAYHGTNVHAMHPKMGRGGFVPLDRLELVTEQTDAELAEAMREAHLKALDLGDQLKVRGYTVKVGEMNDWRRVTIYRDEVKRVTL